MYLPCAAVSSYFVDSSDPPQLREVYVLLLAAQNLAKKGPKPAFLSDVMAQYASTSRPKYGQKSTIGRRVGHI